MAKDDKNKRQQKPPIEKEQLKYSISKRGKGKSERADYPSADKIESRSSTVARAMASTLMPRIAATNDERRSIVLLSLGNIVNPNGENIINVTNNGNINDENKDEIVLIRDKNNQVITTLKLEHLKCVYCGQKAKHLDHLFDFIKDKKPTGYFTEPANLVPCCDQCNQKKGAKDWYQYMIGLENSDKEYFINKLDNYCHEKHLPDRNGKVFDINGKTAQNEHVLDFMGDAEINKWWSKLYNEVVNALHDAQIQIDAFKAGIKYSIRSSVTAVDTNFEQYFAGLIQKEIEELFPEIKDMITIKEKDIKERLHHEFERQITDNINQKNNTQSSEKKRQKSFTLLEYGFRLGQNWEEWEEPHDTKDNNDNDIAKKLYVAAKKAFILGFNYAKQHDCETLKRCIRRGWLNDVIIPVTVTEKSKD